MRYRVLVVGSLVATVVLAGVLFAVNGTPAATEVGRILVLALKVLAAAGSLVAFLEFSRGDYLRSAWAWFSLDWWLLVAADVFRLVMEPVASPATLHLVRGSAIAVSNVASALALVMLGRALVATKLDVGGSSRGRWLTMGLFAVVAVAVAGHSGLYDVEQLLRGDLRALQDVAADAGDIVCFVLIAPLVFAVMALRGGSLWWKFVLLAGNRMFWLVYDATRTYVALTGSTSLGIVAVQDACRVGACLLQASAGLAQHWAVAPSRPAAPIRQPRAA